MKTHLNLLPLPFRRRLVVRRELLRWGAACAVAAMVCLATCLWTHNGLRRRTDELNRLAEEAKPVRVLAASNQALARQLDTAQRRHQLLQSLEGTHPPLQLVGIVSSSTAAKPGTVQVRSLRLTPDAAPTVRQTPANRAGRRAAAPVTTESSDGGRLSLQGVAVNEMALTGFVNQLREARFFESVELRSSSSINLEYGSARQYSVDCRF